MLCCRLKSRKQNQRNLQTVRLLLMVVILEVVRLTIVMAIMVDLMEVLMEGMVLQVPLGHMEVLLVGFLGDMGMVVVV